MITTAIVSSENITDGIADGTPVSAKIAYASNGSPIGSSVNLPNLAIFGVELVI